MIRTQRHSRFVLMSLDEIRATRDIVLQTEETKSNFSGSGKTVYICEVVRPCDYCWKEIERHVNELGLSLNAKTNIYPLKNGIDFLGFHSYLTESGAVIRKVRRKSKNNARRRLTKMRGLLEAGKITPEKVEQSYKSWRGHASKGNCYHLIRNMDQHYNKLFGQYAAAGNRGGVAVSEEKEEGKECRKS